MWSTRLCVLLDGRLTVHHEHLSASRLDRYIRKRNDRRGERSQAISCGGSKEHNLASHSHIASIYCALHRGMAAGGGRACSVRMHARVACRKPWLATTSIIACSSRIALSSASFVSVT